MNSQTIVLNAMRSQGRADALDLRERAPAMDGTSLIAEEEKIPRFDPAMDYSAWKAGAPVWEEVAGERQVFTLITPYNAAHYAGTPATLPALWSIRHTKDPARAKAWVAPNGTSGLYERGECVVENGHVWRNTYDNNEFPPSALPERWEDLGPVEEVQK